MSGDSIAIFIQFLGGLGLFLYGMHVLAAGLQKSAGSRLKKLLEVLTKNKMMGILIGMFVTGIIQSSSATTVMVVGFVNAGLMNLTQSVGVIMGANIGTTVTSWIVASVEWAKFLKPEFFAPLMVAIGASLALFGTKARIKQIGEIIVGFGILFVGMTTMSSSLKPISNSPIFAELFTQLGKNPLLGILVGTLVTAIIQSSSASVGILQALALEGLVPINAAVYIIMGQNIGTCVTAILSSIGASKTAKSAAYIHLLFNVIGSVIFSVLAILYFMFINNVIGDRIITLTEISMIHTSFNLANTLLLYRFSNLLVSIAKKMAGIKDDQVTDNIFIHLDDRILHNPSFALENCIKEIVRLSKMAMENLHLSTNAILDKDQAKISAVMSQEEKIDELTQAISKYLVKISNAGISVEENKYVTSLFHTINDIERIGDHCENLAELATFEIQDNVELSPIAQDELKEFFSVVISCYGNAINALEFGDWESVKKVVEEEEICDVLEKKMRSGHIARLTNNECNSINGVVFLDCLTNMERISDHALNIAETVAAKKPV